MPVDEETLRLLLEERNHLRIQVTELQTRMTEMVERSLSRRVRTFTTAIGHPTRHTPTVPPPSEVRLRLKLVAEECFELIESALAFDGSDEWYWRSKEYITNAIAGPFPYMHAPVDVDLPELADALADIAYVVEGFNACCGIDGGSVLDEVHAANLRKVDGGYQDESGKWRKPEGWQSPDIDGVLRAQGWAP